MNFTKELIVELLEVQAQFDERIEGKNVADTTLAYFVEVFEWINSVESFKNWKTNPGKGKDVELSELADTLAFALSLIGQTFGRLDEEERDYILTHSIKAFDELKDALVFDASIPMLGSVHVILKEFFEGGESVGHNEDTISVIIGLPFIIAHQMYGIDELVAAYKEKMAINHARQDGTADEDKGYV